MKRYFTHLITVILICFSQGGFGQDWTQAFKGNLSADRLKVSSTGGSVGGNVLQGYQFGGLTSDELLQQFALNFAISNVPVENRFKAEVGVPFEITLDFKLANFNRQPTIVDNIILNSETMQGFRGKNGQAAINDANISFPQTSYEVLPEGFKRYVYKQTFTFNEGRTVSWIVFRFTTQEGTLPQSFTIILPFVVEGLYAPIDRDNPVPIKGFFKEPAIPQLILHNPPGDGSTVTFQTNQETCRNIGSNTANDESNTGNLKVTLGIAGQAGMFITAPFEFSASISASAGAGSSVVRSNGQQNCLKIENAITLNAGPEPANEGSLYMGYSSTMAFGTYPLVTISETLPIEVKVDSALMFGLVPGTAAPFYYSKADILNDIQIQQNIADNTTVPRVKQEALNQIKVWQQVLEKDSININNPTNEPLINPTGNTGPFSYTGGNPTLSSSTTLSVSTADTYDVSYFLDASVGASFVLMFGGSGVSGGYEFKTKKTMGQSIENTSNSSTTIAYSLSDNDGGDFYSLKIVKDPTFGTPIFLVDDFLSRTSCPFEGGIQRDKPKLEINGSSLPNITVSNVSLGNAGNFKVKICNNSAEVRDYGFGFVNESVMSDVFISSTAGTGSSPFGENITKLGLITAIPAGGCKTTIYDVNVARRFANSPMSYPNIEFVTFAECEPEIRSSIFATVNFATPPPPTNVSASIKEICSGTPVQLTGNCPVGVPTWYDDPTGGLELGTGSTLTVNPLSTTNYFLGCVANLYNRDRVGTGEIFVTTPFPTLNLTSDFSFNSLQIANTTLTATNKIIDPARVTYKAGNSLTFNPGFEAKSGSTFEAKIGGCAN